MKNYILDSVVISEHNSTEIMIRLQNEGWKNLQYVAHNGWGDCSSPEIMGSRPMTAKEIRSCDRAIKAETNKEIKELNKLAKKYGYCLISDKTKEGNKKR